LHPFDSTRAFNAAREIGTVGLVIGASAAGVLALAAITADGPAPVPLARAPLAGAPRTPAVPSLIGSYGADTGGAQPAAAAGGAGPFTAASSSTPASRPAGAATAAAVPPRAAASSPGAIADAGGPASWAHGAGLRASVVAAIQPASSAPASAAAAAPASVPPPAPTAWSPGGGSTAAGRRLIASLARAGIAAASSGERASAVAESAGTASEPASAAVSQPPSSLSTPFQAASPSTAAPAAGATQSVSVCGRSVGAPSWGPWAGDGLNSGAYDSQGTLVTNLNLHQVSGPLTGTLTAGDTFELVNGVWMFNPNSPGASEMFGSAQAASQATGVPLDDWWGAGPPPPGVAC
jgi:hypothetical protein